MAMTPEASVKAKVRKILDGFGAYYVMPVTSGFGNRVHQIFWCVCRVGS